jgi:hypothetical protein
VHEAGLIFCKAGPEGEAARVGPRVFVGEDRVSSRPDGAAGVRGGWGPRVAPWAIILPPFQGVVVWWHCVRRGFWILSSDPKSGTWGTRA